MMLCARRHSWSWHEGRCFSLKLPGDTGIFHVAKNLPSFVWHPSSLYSLWCVLYRCDRSHCIRFQQNASTASDQTMQTGSFWRQASTFHTVSLGSEKKGFRLECGNPSPKCACLGWEFDSSCSVGGMWLKGHCIEFGVVWIYSAIVVWKWCE